jgi:DNA-binding transcriptional LysR family regulator
MDKLQAMRIFVRVAELNSFSGVAQQFGVARSVVTRQVAALENHLGTKLMARSTRRLTLTSEGVNYLEKCRVILNLVDAAETGIAEERLAPRGLIRISVPLSFGLKRVTPHLLEFVRRYPEVNLDMDYSDRRVNLIEDGIDLSIRITHKLESSDVVRKISHSRLCVIASPDYLARCGTPAHPSELTHHQCLGYTIAGGQQAWQFLVDGQLLSFPLRSQINANNGDALTEAAAQGLGITCQPDFIAQPYLVAGKVKEILTSYALPELGIYAMLPSNRQIPHRVRVLMDFLIAEISASN